MTLAISRGGGGLFHVEGRPPLSSPGHKTRWVPADRFRPGDQERPVHHSTSARRPQVYTLFHSSGRSAVRLRRLVGEDHSCLDPPKLPGPGPEDLEGSPSRVQTVFAGCRDEANTSAPER